MGTFHFTDGWKAALKSARALGIAIAILPLLGLVLAGCTHVRSSPDDGWKAEDGPCCRDVERYPSWLVAIADPVAPLVGHTIARVVWRDGHLDAAAQRAILSELRPFDIVLASSKGRLSGRLIPGLFTHTAVYLGSESELRALGIWQQAAIRRHHDAIRDGATMIEADYKGVHLSRPSSVLNTDRMIVMRPQVTPATRRRILTSLYDHVGSDFDFRFDSGEAECLFCAELVDHTAPELHLPKRSVYGRMSIVPDEVAIRSARKQLPLQFRLYLKGNREGWQRSTRRDLVADIEAEWTRRPLDGNQSRPRKK